MIFKIRIVKCDVFKYTIFVFHLSAYELQFWFWCYFGVILLIESSDKVKVLERAALSFYLNLKLNDTFYVLASHRRSANT